MPLSHSSRKQSGKLNDGIGMRVIPITCIRLIIISSHRYSKLNGRDGIRFLRDRGV